MRILNRIKFIGLGLIGMYRKRIMEHIIPDKLVNLISFLTTPKKDPSRTQDEHTLMTRTNKTRGILVCFIGLAEFARLILGSAQPCEKPFLSAELIGFVLFFLCCKSHLWIYKWYLIAEICLFPLLSFFDPLSNILILQVYPYLITKALYLIMEDMNVFLMFSILPTAAFQQFGERALTRMYHEYAQKDIAAFAKEIHLICCATVSVCFYIIVQDSRQTNSLTLNANTEMKKAVSSLHNLLHSFSHEIRNPINGLLGSLSLATMESISDSVRNYITAAETCGELILQIINNILDSAKTDNTQLEITPKPVNLRDQLNKVGMIWNHVVYGKGLELRTKVSKELPMIVMVDAYRINQILMNLIGNAVKFTHRGKIEIKLEWIETDSEHITDIYFKPNPLDSDDTNEDLFEKYHNFRYFTDTDRYGHLPTAPPAVGRPRKGIIRLTVADSGIGMSPESVSKLFGKFVQVSDDPLLKQKGTGLGLYIIKEIINVMKGKIQVYSKVGRGSVFITCFPTTVVSDGMNINVADTSKAIAILKSRRVRALIIDEVARNVDMMSQYLSKIGCSIAGTAVTGDQGFTKWKEALSEHDPISVIFCDFNLPGLNGSELTKKIREYEQQYSIFPPVFIVLVSSTDHTRTQLNFSQEYTELFYRKPLPFNDIGKDLATLILRFEACQIS
jgi:signal transduction histidine kinase/CheY-like chemotaxis protein